MALFIKACKMKVIPETPCVNLFRFLHFYFNVFSSYWY